LVIGGVAPDAGAPDMVEAFSVKGEEYGEDRMLSNSDL